MNAETPLNLLLMLTAISLRCGFVQKAIVYGRAGQMLFPDEYRFLEMHAYGLLLDGRLDDLEELLAGIHLETRNLAYLRARLAIACGDVDEAASQLRAYCKA
ncbi:hypothetical protein FJU08_16105 [Martelella alba]|uniref:Uncharacterized protein n=1 Tax=Martelella alba TaxID=2590451 RepID=A0A506U6X8_9HYPH|nr:hypothetical protein [Martelella alba]TPW28851.1 hypothetical protein FJU08_16105 [Martelella alba]